ncbi:MAG: 2OG-Fe(II) oxygenase [Acidobacteriota bacterium]|nr:2OG-Fe(II) oxygenase [Acidobacteriota bacterium]
MIDLSQLKTEALSTEPYRWAFTNRLFSTADGEALVKTFPHDHFKTVAGNDGEKGYQYEARSLVAMGADCPANAEHLSPAWQRLSKGLLSSAYREALSKVTGLKLTNLPMEINLFHYGRKAWLGPHVDLEDKVVSHIFYFNDVWDERDGGCLTILRSADIAQAVKVVTPLVGNSVILVRSENSWHAVSRVREGCRTSRRSMTVTFYRPGSPSTMWPAGDATPLHNYPGERSRLGRWMLQTWRQVAR